MSHSSLIIYLRSRTTAALNPFRAHRNLQFVSLACSCILVFFPFFMTSYSSSSSG